MSDVRRCELCKMCPYTRKHHIIPRSEKGKITIDCCETCESFLHKTWSNKQLRDTYNTVESILDTEKFQKLLKWRRKQPNTIVFKSDPGKFRDKHPYH
jgi:formate dehydrogenase maturation protein FdhE